MRSRSRYPSRHSAIAGFAAYAALTVAPMAAQNLITNADFDLSGAGWSVQWGTAGAAGDDADACAGSDSFQILPEVGLGTPIAELGYVGCIPVTAGETLHFELTYRSLAENVIAGVSYFSDAGCSALLNAQMAILVDGSATFATVANAITVNPNAASIRYTVGSQSPSGSAPLFVDRIYVGRRARVFSDDFEPGADCRWSAVAP